jgi:hypothetical protein
MGRKLGARDRGVSERGKQLRAVGASPPRAGIPSGTRGIRAVISLRDVAEGVGDGCRRVEGRVEIANTSIELQECHQCREQRYFAFEGSRYGQPAGGTAALSSTVRVSAAERNAEPASRRLLHSLAVTSRRDANHAAEDLAEVTLVREPGSERDLGERETPISQQGLR